jgi:glycosidase
MSLLAIMHMTNIVRLTVFVLFANGATVCSQARPEPEAGSWTARPALYEVFVRDFSTQGNFAGVQEGLERIEATGANIIWLMPVYPLGQINKKGSIGSPYAVSDYRGVNPDFGNAADLHRLIEGAHARKMKVILDFVANHTAWDHVWIKDHADRYTRDPSGNISVALDNKGKPTDWSDTADLNYNNPDTRRAMIADMRYWIETFDVDGFRMDVAEFVPDDFWREAIAQLRSVKPILMLAEAGDAKMHSNGFDLTYGWSAYGELKDVWNKGRSAAEWVTRQVQDVASLPKNGRRLYFTTNHDETANDKPPITLFGGAEGARAAFIAVTFLPGVPLLYNGEEVESPQKLTLFEKEPVAWDQPNAAKARAFYSSVIQLERTHPAFAGRDIKPVTTNLPNDVIAYRRGNVVVLVNTRPNGMAVTVTGVSLRDARDLLSGNTQQGDVIKLPPYGSVVLELKH